MRSSLRIAFVLTLTCAAVFASAQKLTKLSLSAATVAGGGSVTGTVELSAKAGASGALVTLSASHASAIVPATVAVASGQTSATFSISTTPVAKASATAIKATLGKSSESATLTVEPPKVTGLSFSPSTLEGGSSATGTVNISSAAPTDGSKVVLVTKTAAWGGPSSVVVPAGATSATFVFKTIPVDSKMNADVTAELSGAKASSTIIVTPPVLNAFNLSSTTAVGGTSVTGTVTLSGPAAKDGFKVTLKSKSAAAKVPATVTVAGGATTATFNVTTSSVTSQTAAVLTASAPGASIELSLNVSAVVLTNFSLSSSNLLGGTPTFGTLTLNAPAQAGGFTVSLSSNLAAVKVPATVTIPAGQTSATFQVTTSTVTSTENATITASAPGSTAQTASVAVFSNSNPTKKPPTGKG